MNIAMRGQALFYAVVGACAVIMVLQQPALSQPIAYYDINVAQARAKASDADWSQRRDVARQAQSDFAVATLDDFIKIEEYYDRFIADGVTVHQFRTAYGDNISCIDIATQQSVIAAGLDRTTMPLRPTATPANAAPPEQDVRSVGARQGIDGSHDELGRERSCPDGAFPKVIFAKQNLYRFRTFEDIFRKYPMVAGSDPLQPPAAAPHEYAHAARYNLNNQGLAADFNIWSPAVAVPNAEFSLSQLWVTRGSGTGLQTAEAGWQVYAPLYGDNRSHLFVYGTSDGYSGNSAQSGCYNLTCGRFVQTNNSVAIAGAFGAYSTTNGAQQSITLAYIRDSGGAHNWWFYVNDTPIGYYPNGLYNTNGLADMNANLDFGGEIVNTMANGTNTATDMGSGAFPSAGFGQAAFIKRIRYVDQTLTYQNATGLNPSTTIPALWNIGTINVTTDPNFLTYFFFGGPGSDGGGGGSGTTTVVNSVLPGSRSVQVGSAATAFNSTINAGSVTGTACGLSASAATSIPATFAYQTSNPQTNQLTGTANTPVNIAAGAAQTYVFALTPTGAFAPTNVQIIADCSNSSPGAQIVGVNTILVSASATPVPDIVALAASGDPGYVDIPGASGTGVFAVATVNVGAASSIIASADTGSANIPVQVSLCQTNPNTGACISAVGPTVTTSIAGNATPTFGIFVHGTGSVADNPANNRVFVRFKDGGGATRGSTSVAVRTQ